MGLGTGRHGHSDGAIRPKTWERWRKLTLLANGSLPPLILLEDANDLLDFFEATGRTIPRTKWAIESIAAVQRRNLEAMF